MAAGIGGKTVAEAKENLTWQEVQDWMQYIDRRGPLCVGQRLDFGLADLRVFISQMLLGKDSKAKRQDYLPHYYRPKSERVSDESELTDEALKNLF